MLAGVQPVLAGAQPASSGCAQSPKSSFGKVRRFLWIFADPTIQFWEGVTFLYNFFTKSVISVSKYLKLERRSRICSCLLMLSLCLLVLSLCLHACPGCAQSLKSSSGRVSLSFTTSSKKLCILVRNAPNWKHLEL